MYIKTTKQEQVSLSQIRRENPNISLPRNPSDETLAALGYARIQPTPRPEGDVVTQGQPEQRDGVWYQAWEVREFTAEEVEAQRKSLVPESLTMRQCRIALLDAGLLDAVRSSIATMPGTDGERARIDWEYAQEVRRDWPLIAYMAGDLGLSDEQVDGLFMAAAAI